MEPRAAVYRNVKTGVYYVQSYTIGPVAATWFGEPTVIRPEEFYAKIADAVIASLDKFGKEKYDPARAIRFNSKEQRKFLDSHIEVSVGKPDSGGLIIHPLRREKGGRVGVEGAAIFLSDKDIHHKLADAIAEAFNKST